MFESRSYNTKYLFISLSVIVPAVFAVIFSMTQIDHYNYNKYDIYFSTSVNGLRVGSAVYYKGVNIGFVSLIEVDLPEAKKIKIKVKINKKMPIYKGFVATLGYQGITGYSIIDLSNKSTTHEILKPGEIINSEPSVIDNLYLFLPHLMDSCSKIIDKLNNLVHNEQNVEDIIVGLKKGIQNLEKISSKASKNFDEFHNLLIVLKATFINFDNLISSITLDKEYFHQNYTQLMLDIVKNSSQIANEVNDSLKKKRGWFYKFFG